MRHVCILFILCSLSHAAFSQFTFVSGPEVTMNLVAPYETGDVKCFPDSIQDMTINWELIEIESSIPAGWDLTICDNLLCYPTFPSVGAGIPFTAQQFLDGETFLLKLGVTSYGIPGSGDATYYIFDVATGIGDTVVFHLNQLPTGIEYSINQPQVQWSVSDNTIQLNSTSTKAIKVQLFTLSGALIDERLFCGQVQLEPCRVKGMYVLIINEKELHKIAIH